MAEELWVRANGQNLSKHAYTVLRCGNGYLTFMHAYRGCVPMTTDRVICGEFDTICGHIVTDRSSEIVLFLA